MLENIDGIVTKDDIYRLLSHATTGTPDNGVIITPTQLASLCALVKALPPKDYEPVCQGQRRIKMADEVRLIDANALLKEIEEEIEAEKTYDNYDKGVTAGIRIALRDIKKQTTIEAEPVDDWINVDDRLPENDGLYIVCKTIGEHQIVFEARWQDGDWKSVVKNNHLDFITHWQPLPKPPKGE